MTLLQNHCWWWSLLFSPGAWVPPSTLEPMAHRRKSSSWERIPCRPLCWTSAAVLLIRWKFWQIRWWLWPIWSWLWIINVMVTQHIPTSHIPTRWEYVIMLRGGNMTQSHSHHTHRFIIIMMSTITWIHYHSNSLRTARFVPSKHIPFPSEPQKPTLWALPHIYDSANTKWIYSWSENCCLHQICSADSSF